MKKRLLAYLLVLAMLIPAVAQMGLAAPASPEGMEVQAVSVESQTLNMVKIPSGSFVMGSTADNVHVDELPAHQVNITQNFYLAENEVTNALFELFKPEHSQVRGKLGYRNMFNDSIGQPIIRNGTPSTIFKGFSSEDDEAAIFVSWDEAVAFCKWLNENYLPEDLADAGYIFRLPTEAEWEYACRAGTTTDYNTGDTFPADQQNANSYDLIFYPDPARMINSGANYKPSNGPLTVKKYDPNAWGLYDMHGNVEEWVLDWYGYYAAGEQDDPVGPVDGLTKVARGGSHSALVKYLRSANRSSAARETQSWIIGFRVALGQPVDMKNALPREDGAYQYQQNVNQETVTSYPYDYDAPGAPPVFIGPKSDADSYVRISGSNVTGPFFEHNHQPGVTVCPNGDLLAIWYTGAGENSRELNNVISRRPYDAETGTYGEWTPAEMLIDSADRNNHGAALFTDHEEGKIVFICGQSATAAYGGLLLLMMESYDNGATWSEPRVIADQHQIRQQAIGAAFVAPDGTYVLTCDANSTGNGGSAMWLSKDKGRTWTDAGAASFAGQYGNDLQAYLASPSSTGGIHASVVQLVDEDGETYYLGAGRGDTISGKMPFSITYDEGKTWVKSASLFPPIGSGQRLVMKRLESGAVMLCAFGRQSLTDPAGEEHSYNGLYAALSYDNGVTWPYMRYLTDDELEPKSLDGKGNTGRFTMDRYNCEPKGYLTCVQTDDGLIHLLSSAFEYQLNEAWIIAGFPQPEVTGVSADKDTLAAEGGDVVITAVGTRLDLAKEIEVLLTAPGGSETKTEMAAAESEATATITLPANETHEDQIYYYAVYVNGVKVSEDAAITVSAKEKPDPDKPVLTQITVLPENIVSGAASNIWVVVTGENLEGETVIAAITDGTTTYGSAAVGSDGKAIIRLAAAPAAGTYQIVAYIDGSPESEITGSINVITVTNDIWDVTVSYTEANHIQLKFHADIQARDGVFDTEVQINGKAVACTQIDERTLEIMSSTYSELLEDGFNSIVISGVKLYRIYPSFTFRFNLSHEY